MRLVVTDAWVQLEPETPAEMAALEASAAGGECTKGRGDAAIATLSALAARLGFPVGVPERRMSPRLLVVQRGEPVLYGRLMALARGESCSVIWDRRQAERRTDAEPAAVDRRRRDRRQPPPPTWPVLRFLVVRPPDAPPHTLLTS